MVQAKMAELRQGPLWGTWSRATGFAEGLDVGVKGVKDERDSRSQMIRWGIYSGPFPVICPL